MARKSKGGGCLRTIWRGFLWVVGLFVGIAILSTFLNRNNSPTQQPTPMVIVVTATPLPATETPTSAPTPLDSLSTLQALLDIDPAEIATAVSGWASVPVSTVRAVMEADLDSVPTVDIRTRVAAVGETAAAAAALLLPTDTPQPPTRTPEPPTAMPAPPTATLIPPTATMAMIDLRASDGELVVVTWNVGLDDASIDVIADGIRSMPGVDIWLIQEARGRGTAQALELAAEAEGGVDFTAVLGSTGNDIPLLTMFNEERFDLLGVEEINAVNTTGNARSPLVLHLLDTETTVEFLAMNNHLYRSREDERDKQAALLNAWALEQTLPVINGGDHNFDYDVPDGPSAADRGFDNLIDGGVWEWVRPGVLVPTQCTDSLPCTYDDILDFIFVAGPAREWTAVSDVIVRPGDFPDDALKSDHRPVVAIFLPQVPRRVVVVEPASIPTVAPTATRFVIVVPRVNSAQNVNLRSGPGTNYAIVGQAAPAQQLEITGINTIGDWYQLGNGAWVAAFLVNDAPAVSTLEIIAVAAPTAAPTPLPAPTSTPLPVVVQPPPQRSQPVGNCDPSYPDVCIPSPPPDLDCGDIPYRYFRVIGSDPHRFDGNHDGEGCES